MLPIRRSTDRDCGCRAGVRRAALGLLGLVACLSPAAADESGIELSIITGMDSNPLQQTGDGTNGGFLEGRLSASFRKHLRGPWNLELGLRGRTQQHESSVTLADETRATGRAALEWDSPTGGKRRATLALGLSYHLDRSIFLDPSTGDVYRVAPVPPTTPATQVPIADRFDRDGSGLFLDLRWRVHPRVLLALDTTRERWDYLDRSIVGTGLESLDHEIVRVEPGMTVRLSPELLFELVWTHQRLDYAAQPPLDSSGSPVGGATRRDRYDDLAAAVRFTPFQRWSVDLGLRTGRRDDLHAGYYDYQTVGGFLALEHRPGWRSRLRVYGSLRDLDYGHATVPGSTDGENRGNDVRRVVGRFDYRIVRNQTWFVEGGMQQTESRDPLFAYDRDWWLTGWEYRR